jgi:pantetheine-phosphate adenylyltransferase
MNKTQTLYPGSFDPVTRGHEDLIVRANENFDLTVGVAVNPGKSPAFTLQERVRLLQRSVQKYGMDPLSVVRISWSTARWMKRHAVNTIVRGKRNIIDELGEKELQYYNQLEYSDLETTTLDADECLKFASSTAAKRLLNANHNPSSIISLDVQEASTSRLLWQYPVYIAGGMWAGKSSVARSMIFEARKYGINTKHIELDTVAHDIYASLDDAYYAQVRARLRDTFGSHISPDGNWIDRSLLAIELKNGDQFDEEKLKKLDSIMADPIEFRYKDMIEWFQGIIIIDGIITEWLSFSRFAHNNVMFVDAEREARLSRVMDRYTKNGNPKSEEYILSIMDKQLSLPQMGNIVEANIWKENHGSINTIDNTSSIDSRKTFFQLLNQIDRYGELRSTWILSKLGIQGNMRDHLNFLQSKYNESHRYYHTWEHIIESLTTLFQIVIDLDLTDEEIMIVWWGLLWHDIVYSTDPTLYRTNESNSARIWIRYLEQHGVNINHLEEIEDLIKETRHGRVNVPDTLMSQVMHDVDMAILGSPWERYRIYKEDILSEYAATIPWAKFRTLRLDKFLIPVEKLWGNLYKTEWARSRFSEDLIENLRREIDWIS